MKCLYRNTPDVARHAPMAATVAKPETRANYQGHAYNVRKNAEVRVISYLVRIFFWFY